MAGNKSMVIKFRYSILAWRIPWTEEPDRLCSMRLKRVGWDFCFQSKVTMFQTCCVIL